MVGVSLGGLTEGVGACVHVTVWTNVGSPTDGSLPDKLDLSGRASLGYLRSLRLSCIVACCSPCCEDPCKLLDQEKIRRSPSILHLALPKLAGNKVKGGIKQKLAHYTSIIAKSSQLSCQRLESGSCPKRVNNHPLPASSTVRCSPCLLMSAL